jgi:diguanylate cyclase (GGDEF)-like protein
MKLTLSLRTKFTLVLLISSLLSLFAAGLIARAILLHEFSDIVMHQSFQRFHTEMTVYFETYGSWKNAQQKESFEAFEQRRRNLFGSPMPDRATLSAVPIPGNLLLPPAKPHPPFRFAVADPNGKILMGNNQLKAGFVAPKQLRQKGMPIFLNGKIVALTLPNAQPNLNDLDLGYLKAMRLALMAAGFTAALFALFFGLVIGSRINGRLSRLTLAIKAMQAGNLFQRVEEKSGDEIGLLANAFNQMSSELTEMHDALHKSNLQISCQAKQLKELSIRDDLTGLYNRRHANQEGTRLFETAIKNSEPLSIVMGDIDFFKEINDGNSHATGDEVLRQIAMIFQKDARSSDILARYGGEEFVLILPQTPGQSAVVLCERLRKKIEQHSWNELAPNLSVTISFGVCDDTACDSFERQLEMADDKLREAKQNGRNLVCFDISDDAQDTKVLS